MIPVNRPVIGSDLDDVRQQFGLSTTDAIWLYGLSITRWTQIVRKEGELPLKDPTLALLARLLDAFPDLQVVPRHPTPAEAYETLLSASGGDPLDKKRFSILMGKESTGGYRWMTLGSRPSPVLSRLMHFLTIVLGKTPKDDMRDVVRAWANIVDMEARSRGSDDVFRTGKWSQASAKRFLEKRAEHKLGTSAGRAKRAAEGG